MNTLRACATVGLGLSLVLGSGCSSNSKSGNTDGGTRDTRRTDGPGTNPGPDTTPAGPCTIQGNTVQSGRTIVIDCITWLCQGNNNVTTTGAACSDASPTPDAAVNRDAASPTDTRPVDSSPAIDGSVGKDTQPVEAGPVKLDGGNKDTVVSDVLVPLDTAPPEPDLAVVVDTAPPEPDLPVVAEDTAPPVITCTSESGQKYYAGGGVCFPCASSLCVCDANGVITQSASCSPVDAQ